MEKLSEKIQNGIDYEIAEFKDNFASKKKKKKNTITLLHLWPLLIREPTSILKIRGGQINHQPTFVVQKLV